MAEYIVSWRQMRWFEQDVLVKADSFREAVEKSQKKLGVRKWVLLGDMATTCRSVSRKVPLRVENRSSVMLHEVKKKFIDPRKAHLGLASLGSDFWATIEGDEIESALAKPAGKNKKAGLR